MQASYKKIAIVHFQPVEYYPPVTNFINVIAADRRFSCYVFTTSNVKLPGFTNSDVDIKRILQIKNSRSPILRVISYYWFNVATFLNLLWLNPSTLFYYESYSALPVYWYLKLFRNKKLWIHNHEYFEPQWYQKGMKTVRYYHKKEVTFLYSFAEGISQTNEFRLKFFLKDYPIVESTKMNVIPNYPPGNWHSYHRRIEQISLPLRVIYVGSVSLKATYVKEFCEWVMLQKGNVLFDIYTLSNDASTEKYLFDLKSQYIRLNNQGTEYSKIPELISSKKYDIGVILYKGHSLNNMWCASNKLFEYLTCGLDVWFSQEMHGTYPYITQNTYPRVLKVDFTHLEYFNFKEEVSHDSLLYKPFEFCCETVFEALLPKLS